MPRPSIPAPIVTRRTALLGGMAGIALLATGCGTDTAATPAANAAPVPTDTALTAAEQRLTELEKGFGGHLGFIAIDTGNGATIGHRADERFLMCSTHKVLTVAAALHASRSRSDLLDQRIHFTSAQATASGWAPITSRHAGDGMTVADLCAAALTHSDNLADLLVMQTVGGPAGVTAYARTLGDRVTRLDRYEPELNDGAPGDERDTSTPAQLATDLRTLLLGLALPAVARDRLTGWMHANTTGDKLIRAGVPRNWQVGDKTGAGNHGEENDIAVLWPPHRAPIVVAALTVPADPNAAADPTVVAAAAKIAADTLSRA